MASLHGRDGRLTAQNGGFRREQFTVKMTDRTSDGFCCNSGNGSYTVVADGSVQASGTGEVHGRGRCTASPRGHVLPL